MGIRQKTQSNRGSSAYEAILYHFLSTVTTVPAIGIGTSCEVAKIRPWSERPPELGAVRGDAVLSAGTSAHTARDLWRLGQLRRQAEAFRSSGSAEEIHSRLRQRASAVRVVPDGVWTIAGEMPVVGGVWMEKEISVQELADESGIEHD